MKLFTAVQHFHDHLHSPGSCFGLLRGLESIHDCINIRFIERLEKSLAFMFPHRSLGSNHSMVRIFLKHLSVLCVSAWKSGMQDGGAAESLQMVKAKLISSWLLTKLEELHRLGLRTI
jgi:hypothetical protein